MTTSRIDTFQGLIWGLVLACLLGSCQKDAKSGLVIEVNHVVGMEPLLLEDRTYHAAAGHDYRIYRLKYYLSNFSLQTANGTEYSCPLVQYCDVEDPGTLRFSLPGVPSGDYTQLNFMIGLDASQNRPGGLGNRMEHLNMIWPVPGEEGYHYMKLEGRYDSLKTGVLKSFNLHTGATGNHQNAVTVVLPLRERPLEGPVRSLILEMNLAAWLNGPPVYDFADFGPGIMDNQDAQQQLKDNGARVFSIAAVNDK